MSIHRPRQRQPITRAHAKPKEDHTINMDALIEPAINAVAPPIGDVGVEPVGERNTARPDLACVE